MTCITVSAGTPTVILRPNILNSIVTIDSAVTYDNGYCGEWAIYYLNAYGGYDAFLFEGSVKHEVSKSRNTYTRAYDNRTQERGKTDYIEELTETYICNSGWLSDEESARFAKHVLSSPTVYLHDIVNDKVYPVNITDSSWTYKTRQTESRLVNYTITLELCHERLRAM